MDERGFDMKVVRLQIDHQLAQIQMQSQRAQLNIESPRRGMDVNMNPAKMSVDFKPGSVQLDSTSLKENTARKSVFALQRQFAAESFQNAQQGIERIVQEGDYVAQQPNPGNTWGTLATNRMLEVNTPTYSRGSVPVNGTSMNGYGGQCQISWTEHELEINWEVYESPHVTVDPQAAVEIRLAQEPQISCKTVEENIPPEIGQNIDVLG